MFDTIIDIVELAVILFGFLLIVIILFDINVYGKSDGHFIPIC
jgi:hypothetical protein